MISTWFSICMSASVGECAGVEPILFVSVVEYVAVYVSVWVALWVVGCVRVALRMPVSVVDQVRRALSRGGGQQGACPPVCGRLMAG